MDGIHETGPALAEAILENNCLQSFHLDTLTKHQQHRREESPPCLSTGEVVSDQREGSSDGTRLAGFRHSGTNQQNGCLVTGLLVDCSPLGPISGRRGKFP